MLVVSTAVVRILDSITKQVPLNQLWG